MTEPPPIAIGSFSHPNGVAMFLSARMMIGLGWSIGRGGIWRQAAPVVICAVIVLIYSTGAYSVVLVGLLAFFLLLYIRPAKGMSAAVLAPLLAAVGILAALSSAMLNPLCRRYGLWTTAISLLAGAPTILVFGNGMRVFGDLAYYFQPPSTYVCILLEYGLPGLAVVWAILLSIVLASQRDRRAGRWVEKPLLPAAWVAALGFFVAGMVESVLLGMEDRLIVISFIARYLGLRDEIAEDSCHDG